jgi:hypothetical protein
LKDVFPTDQTFLALQEDLKPCGKESSKRHELDDLIRDDCHPGRVEVVRRYLAAKQKWDLLKQNFANFLEGTNAALDETMHGVLDVLQSAHEIQEYKVRVLEGDIRTTMMANHRLAEDIEQHSKEAVKRRKDFFSNVIQSMHVNVQRATKMVIDSK